MSESLIVISETRADRGKGASRRLRRLEGKLPGVIYGGNKPSQSIVLNRKDFEHMLENEACYTSILEVQVDGDKQNAIIKDIQRHPAKGSAMHADFLRVQMDKPIKVNVPLRFSNEDKCTGVKLGGGMIQKQQTDIEVQCLPSDLPEFIEVDMEDVELGQIVHLSDISLPEGVASIALALGDAHDLAIASVAAPKGGITDDEDIISDIDGDDEGEADDSMLPRNSGDGGD